MTGSPSFQPYESAYQKRGFFRVIGCDEAGRGPLAGPVVAASVLLKEGAHFKGLTDSKKLTPKKRDFLFEQITGSDLVEYGVGIVAPSEIDQINILDAILIDGNIMPTKELPGEAIVKGDLICQSIAAASIIAKVSRDRMMQKYDEQWPEYGFAGHMGYGTKKHREAIEKYGPTPIHRMSFEPLKSMFANARR